MKACPIFNLFILTYHQVFAPRNSFSCSQVAKEIIDKSPSKTPSMRRKLLRSASSKERGRLVLPVKRIYKSATFGSRYAVDRSIENDRNVRAVSSTLLQLLKWRCRWGLWPGIGHMWHRTKKHPKRCQVIDAFWVDRCELNVLYAWWILLLQLPITNRLLMIRHTNPADILWGAAR